MSLSRGVEPRRVAAGAGDAEHWAPAPSGSRETAERLRERNRGKSVANRPIEKAPSPGLFP